MLHGHRSLTLAGARSLTAIASHARGPRGECLFLDGRGSGADAWQRPGLVGLEPRCLLRVDARDDDRISTALARIESLWKSRIVPDSDGSTGLAVLLTYEALRPSRGDADREPFPAIVVLAVDRSIRVDEDRGQLSVRADTAARVDEDLGRWSGRLENLSIGERQTKLAGATEPRTSLPRESYQEAVRRVQQWIAEGTFYQANLCQRIDAGWAGEALDYYERLSSTQGVPRSAFVSVDGFELASFSPETFLTLKDGWIETLPIKGTRPRGRDPAADRAAIADLLASPKDRAELLMIVDLERNDLGRLCAPGSVEVPQLVVPQSYPAVHHLVARVRGRLREDVGWTEIVRAAFPGGSITGAPKKSAMERLREVEPLPRGPFTGSLFWCGDDGSMDSSILIRTAVFSGGRVTIGAGGGIVADSDPRSEWEESNHKVRALTNALGFEPEELD